MRRYVRKPPRRIIIEAVPATAVTSMAAMLTDLFPLVFIRV
jgi:hypothetical protein